MTRPVRLLFFTQTLDCETCLQTRQILDELPPLSDKITIEEVNFVLEGEQARRHTASIARRRLRHLAGRARRSRATTRGSAFSARRRATSSSRWCRPCCSPAARPSQLSDDSLHASRGGRPAGDDARVHDADLSALSAGREPRARDGVCQPPHHGVCRRSHRVSRSRAPLPGHRRAEDRRRRRRSRFSARCPRATFVEQALAKFAAESRERLSSPQAFVHRHATRCRAGLVSLRDCLVLRQRPFHAASRRSRTASSFPEPQHHWMQVEATFPDLPAAPLELRMSRSSPGRYSLHDFAKNVYDVHAFAARRPRAADRRGRIRTAGRSAITAAA